MRSLCKQSVGERHLREARILVAPCEERDVIAVRAYLGPADFYDVPAVPVFVMGYGMPYISIAAAYESLALATTVRNDCR